MVSLQNINLYFGSNHLLDSINFVISPGEKIALIGKNGAGKTTLFKIITNEISPDSGQIAIPGDFKIGYLSQHFDFDDTKGLQEICMEVFKEYFDMEDMVIKLSEELGHNPSEKRMIEILEKLDELNIKIQAAVGTNPLADIAKILKGLGFTEDQFDKPVTDLSGGWKMRVQIAKLLLLKPDLLLLDEPDNHLDIEALIWFEKYIINYPGAVLFISHDVEFMSNTANRILELSNRKISDYKSNYRKYLESKALRLEKEEQAFTNQQKEIKQKEKTINRFMAKATKTKMAQSMKKQLDKVERIELESEDITNINIQFPPTPQSGKRVLNVKSLYKSFGDKNVIADLNMEIERDLKIAFVGQNGQGKSTLVKLIADKLKADSGIIELGHNVIVSYFAQNQSEIFDNKLDVLESLELHADVEFAPYARKTLGAFAFSGEDVYKKVSVLSGGEKSRLAMACMVSQKSNFLLLDEPTNHLDIQSKARLKQAIANYPGTLIIVSHDRDILRGIIDITYEFKEGEIHQHLGDLDYVLNKRKQDDIRSFETHSLAVKSNAQTNNDSKLSYQEQKQLNRQLSNTEKRIEDIEAKIKSIQEKLYDPEFFNSDDGPKAVKELKQLEESLTKQNTKWDQLVINLEQ